MIRTLIVEDDYHVATIHAAYVRRIHGFEVAGHASTLATARAEIARLAPDLVLLDLYLPDGHGLDLVRERREQTEPPDFLVITAARDMASVRSAMQLGTVHYLVKLPKGQSGPTMARIREHLSAAGNDLSAADIAERIGISRSTAQRYLAELARQGAVELHLHYGAAGRPEHRYRIAAGVE
jgi:response regulator of citrate/malate metabolism